MFFTKSFEASNKYSQEFVFVVLSKFSADKSCLFNFKIHNVFELQNL
jgi:hypothetical protein